MNNQQVAREIYQTIGGKTGSNCSVGVIKRVLNKHYGWISVEDKLPSTQELVALLRKEGVVGFGFKDSHLSESKMWTDMTQRDRDGNWLYTFDVTHWYPIPGVVG